MLRSGEGVMSMTIPAIVAVLLLPFLSAPLCAGTALEQFQALGLEAENPPPQPEVAKVEEANLSSEGSQKKITAL